ncbi:exodeoxyribonuclease VII large subunit [Stappia sp. 22II-S9-Z10]|nr:exodeoxyribonuclease VII large subunit [Stappia sp. 22II-S9-Z10]
MSGAITLLDDDEPSKSSGSNAAEFSVSELSRAVKRTVEDGFGYVRVRGEISGFRGRHGSGHCYFSLKDADAAIDAVVWKGAWGKLATKPEEGLEVIATGRLTTFARSSKYQIVVDNLEPAGLGALMKQLEERRKKLAAEGLFDEARKRPLPLMPRVIGVVTSPTGAVIRDILHRISDRFPAHVVVWPVRVQGETSGAEVTAAVKGFAGDYGGPRPDVIIVARGGGSVEDLWGYNDEALVRAVAASPIPVVSAVGHETDWTLVDHAADHRAPTPTGAAERVVPVRSECLATLSDRARRLDLAISAHVRQRGEHLRFLSRGLPAGAALVEPQRQRLDIAADRLTSALYKRTADARHRWLIATRHLSPAIASRPVERARDRLTMADGRLGRAADALLSDRRAAALRSAARLSPRLLERPVREAGDRLARTVDRRDRAMAQHLGAVRQRLAGAERMLSARLLEQPAALARERLSRTAERHDRAFAHRVAQLRQHLTVTDKLLSAVSYQGVLGRGFALVRRADAGLTVRSAAAVAAGERLELQFADGRVTVTEGSAPGAPAPATGGAKKAAAVPARRRSKKTDDRQGILL